MESYSISTTRGLMPTPMHHKGIHDVGTIFLGTPGFPSLYKQY